MRSGWAAAKASAMSPPPMFGDQCGPFGADLVEDDAQVLHPFVDRRQRRRRHRVRQTGAPLVEHDQPPERGESLPETGQRGDVPLGLHVAEPLIDEQHIERARPEDLVRQVEVASSGIPGLGGHGR